MRFLPILLCCAAIMTSCNSVKRNEKLLSRGSYDQAIELAIKKIQNDRNAQAADQHKHLLAEAFARASERDERTVRKLSRLGGLNNLRSVYYTWMRMDNRQERIRPLIPLVLTENGQTLNITFKDFTNEIRNAKERFAKSLLRTSKDYLYRNSKADARYAYELLDELNDLHPHDREVDNLIGEARFRGTDYILVQLVNRSNQILPEPLENELLDFGTYGLDDFWSEYHNVRRPGINYDYGINLNFRQIDFSPERIFEQEERRTRRIKDGSDYRRDRDGRIITDENGDPVRVDRFRTVSAVLRITEQTKAVRVSGQVVYRDYRNQNILKTFPLGNEFVFQNVFATFQGDERALSDEDLDLTRNRFQPFPSNAQLLMTSGDELKSRLSGILRQL